MNLFCTQCGHQNEADSRFCEACGKPLTSRVVSQEPGPARPVARGSWFLITAAILLLLAAGVFLAAVLVPSSSGPPALAQLGIGHKPLEQAVVGKWSFVGEPTVGFEFFPDKTFSWANKDMPLNGKWVVVGERRIKADVTMLGTVLLLFEDVEISGNNMSGSLTIGDKNNGRFSLVRVKDSSGDSNSLKQQLIGKWESRTRDFPMALEFLPDMTIIMAAQGEAKKGTWTVVGKRGVKGDLIGQFVFDDIEISGNKMTFNVTFPVLFGDDKPHKATQARVK